MQILTASTISQIPQKVQWDNYVNSFSGGYEISTEFLNSLEKGFGSEVYFYYITIQDRQEKTIICCPTYISHNVPLEVILPDNIIKKSILKLGKIKNFWLRPKVLFVGTPLNDELDILLEKNLFLDNQEIINSLIKELEKISKNHEANLIIFKNVTNCNLFKYLKQMNFFQVQSLPNSLINCNYSSFDKFLNSLDSRKRRNIKSKLRKAHKFSYKVEIKHGARADLNNIFLLFEETYHKSNFKFERPTLSLFKNLGQQQQSKIIWIDILENNIPIACAYCYLESETLVMKRVGIDSESQIPFLYFILHYETIKYAIKHQIKSIKLGPTAYEAKKEMGAYLQPTFLFCKHNNLVINKLLNVFYQVGTKS